MDGYLFCIDESVINYLQNNFADEELKDVLTINEELTKWIKSGKDPEQIPEKLKHQFDNPANKDLYDFDEYDKNENPAFNKWRKEFNSKPFSETDNTETQPTVFYKTITRSSRMSDINDSDVPF